MTLAEIKRDWETYQKLWGVVNNADTVWNHIESAYQSGRESMRKEIEAELPGEKDLMEAEIDEVKIDVRREMIGFNICLNQVKSIIGTRK